MKAQKGFGLVEIIIVVAVVAVAGIIGWLLWSNVTKSPPQAAPVTQEEDAPDRPVGALQRNQVNTQIKTDVARTASAVVEYVSNNTGSYPATQEQADGVVRDYLGGSEFRSPLTKKPYLLSLSEDRALGTINLLKGECNNGGNGVVAASSPRQYAVLTLLVDDSVYCLSL